MFKLKRIYEAPLPDDGARVLVDRLWPRGVSKARAALDLWMKDIGPSTELRQWFDHDPAKWSAFQDRYAKELEGRTALVDELRRKERHGAVTLLYAARDEEHNEAVALKAFLDGSLEQSQPPRPGV
jgi:uncharacterized protein YeaO (DUF488 family)